MIRDEQEPIMKKGEEILGMCGDFTVVDQVGREFKSRYSSTKRWQLLSTW